MWEGGSRELQDLSPVLGLDKVNFRRANVYTKYCNSLQVLVMQLPESMQKLRVGEKKT